MICVPELPFVVKAITMVGDDWSITLGFVLMYSNFF